MTQKILQRGWGYYDVTSLPYGGSFHRASEDVTIEVIDGSKGQQADEVQAKLKTPDGSERRIVVRIAALSDTIPAN